MPHQSDLRFTFVPLASPAHFDVIEFELDEGLSQPFCLRLKLASADPDLDFQPLLDQPALFTLWRGEQPLRRVHGLVSSLSIGQAGFRRTHYDVVVEPQLARLGLCSNWRIFQGLSVPQIIDQVLGEHQVLYREQHLRAEHAPREYCVQAGETDLQFLARLAAEEGLVYRFEHTEKQHRLVHADQAIAFGVIDSDDFALPYLDRPGGDPGAPGLWQLRYTEQVRSARQVQRDYTFKHPNYQQQHEAVGTDLQHQAGHYERFDYPGRYKRDLAGKPFTHTRLLALRGDARLAETTGDDTRVQAGLAFTLHGHPRQACNGLWRTLSIRHHGIQHTSLEDEAATSDQGTRYSHTAVHIDGKADWKAPLLPKPRIDGPQTATVVGPPGEEIYCDRWGRVKVSFPWDRYSRNDADSSCWIRVTQGWAGTMWGSMAIPRIGQELIISYLDGDPDQPIATGRAYRETHQPPYELPKHKTRMTIKSRTHKGDMFGSNELRFEDESGQEEVFIHAERDQNNVVKHNETTRVGNDRSEDVGHDERVEIGHDRRETVGNDENVEVGQDRQHDIGRDDLLLIGRHHSIRTAQDRTEQVGNHRRDQTTANHWVEIGGHQEQQVQGHALLHAGQAIRHTTVDYEIQAAQSLVIKTPGGSLRLDAAGITLDGVAIHINGPVVQQSTGSSNTLQVSGTPNAGEPVCVSCLLKAIAEGHSVVQSKGVTP